MTRIEALQWALVAIKHCKHDPELASRAHIFAETHDEIEGMLDEACESDRQASEGFEE